jgi:hypothetical protein
MIHKMIKLLVLQENIDKVKDTMVINIDKALARGDRLDTLQSKSDDLKTQSDKFRAKATELKKNLCMQNAKTMIMVSIAVVALILIIVMIACNPNFSKC